MSPAPPRDPLQPDPSNPVLVHFYRAVVAHMDVWRQRMDATTNWAAATTAGMLTFCFGDPASPHFILLIAMAFNAMFLLMEARRYQLFDLWRQRFRVLNRYFVAPALSPASADADAETEALHRLAQELGTTLPSLRLAHALGYRIARNYGYLFGLTLLAWLLKLEIHPSPARSAAELVERAAVGLAPGPAVAAGVGIAMVALLVLMLVAPSPHVREWAPLRPRAAPWRRNRAPRP